MRASLLAYSVSARAAEEGRIGRLCSERAACRGMHVGGIERWRRGSRPVVVLSEGTLARDVTKEYSRGTTSHGERCVGTGRAWLLRGRRSTSERPSPPRVCSFLGNNALTGSVPSLLSALTNLEDLCVPPSCHRSLRVRPRRFGSIGFAPSARQAADGGCMAGQGVDSGGGMSRYLCFIGPHGLKGY